jgi:3-oxoadipate enol-lactonase
MAELHHVVEGAEGAPVLVLSTSLGTTLEMWDPQAAALAERFRLVRYDQLGHGRSDVVAGPYSVDALGAALLELLDSLGVERFSFCGLSLGGALGLWLGASEPDRVERLAVCCTSAHFGSPELWEGRAAAVRADGVGSIADAVVERWFTGRFARERADEVARFRAMLAATPAEGYAACCEAIRDWDFRARLGEIRAPTLVLMAGDDAATPPEEGERIAAGVPGARLLVVPEAAHLANVEQPEAVTRALLEHLAG